MRARAILIAAAVLVVALGGGAVWLAANDKEHPSTELFSSSESPERSPAPSTPEPAPAAPAPSTPDTAPAPATPTEATPTETTPAAPSGGAGAGSGGGASTNGGTSAPRKTHFKSEPKSKPRNDEPQRSFEVPPARQFTGEGNASLGTVDVTAPALLKWRTKGRFEVRFGREEFPIIAPTSSGQLVLPPFRFEQVRVIATGRWRISISPQ